VRDAQVFPHFPPVSAAHPSVRGTMEHEQALRHQATQQGHIRYMYRIQPSAGCRSCTDGVGFARLSLPVCANRVLELPRDRGRSQDPQDGDSVSAFCRSCNEDRGPHRPHATHCTHLCRALSRACPQSKSALVGLEVTVLWAAGPQERMPACTRAHSQCAQAAVGSAVGSALATGYRSATAADRPPV